MDDGTTRDALWAGMAEGDEAWELALPIVRAAAEVCAAPADPAHGEPVAVDRAAYERLRAALAALHAAWVAALREGEGLEA
jgi:hypothetical protein